MASVDTPAPEPEKVAEAASSEPEKAVVVEAEAEKAAPPPPELKGGNHAVASPPTDYFALADLVLRFLLFASGLVAVVVLVTGNQTETVPIPFPPFRASVPAKFNHSPALIYFVAALSVTGLYGIITTLLSFYAVLKPGCYPKVLSHFVILDVLLLGIVAAATGAAGGVGYVGLRGNSHVRWTKICNVYDEFCRHLAGSLAASLFGSIVLTLLILLSIYSLSKKIPK